MENVCIGRDDRISMSLRVAAGSTGRSNYRRSLEDSNEIPRLIA